MKITIKRGYSAMRRESFPSTGEQLDMLWHEIDAGAFGEQAKTGDFYNSIKTVKDCHPKDNQHSAV